MHEFTTFCEVSQKFVEVLFWPIRPVALTQFNSVCKWTSGCLRQEVLGLFMGMTPTLRLMFNGFYWMGKHNDWSHVWWLIFFHCWISVLGICGILSDKMRQSHALEIFISAETTICSPSSGTIIENCLSTKQLCKCLINALLIKIPNPSCWKCKVVETRLVCQ